MPNLEFPDVETYLIAWLTAKLKRPIYTETDTTLTQYLPAYQIARVGGSDGAEVDKRVNIEITAIVATRGELWAAVQNAESAMRALSANGTASWYVDDVEETFSFAIEPYENDGVRRARATYALTLRPQPITSTEPDTPVGPDERI